MNCSVMKHHSDGMILWEDEKLYLYLKQLRTSIGSLVVTEYSGERRKRGRVRKSVYIVYDSHDLEAVTRDTCEDTVLITNQLPTNQAEECHQVTVLILTS